MPDPQPFWDEANWDEGYWDAAPAPTIKKKMNITIALNLTGLTPPQKLAKLQTAIDKCTGNPAIGTLTDPTLADCQAAHNAADVQIKLITAKEDELKALRTTRDQLVDAAMTLYASLGSVVQTKARNAGDPAIVPGAGYDLAGAGTPVSPNVARITGLTLTQGDHDGTVDAGWHRDKKSHGYVLQVCTADPSVEANWKVFAHPAVSSSTLTGLTSGQKIWVRVCGSDRNGNGPWSDPATIVVP